MERDEYEWETISFQEFCNEAEIESDSWIFANVYNPVFRKRIASSGRSAVYSFNNGIGVIREFKYMEEYGEIWSRFLDCNTNIEPKWSLWVTWKVLD